MSTAKNTLRLMTCLLLAAIVTIVALEVVSAHDINPPYKYAWGTNVGWINFAPTHGGVTVYADHLEGYAWGENVGWIRMGTHTGGGSHTYANTEAANYGVNITGTTLSGYAWGANIGWIHFAPTHGGVTIDWDTGELDGYAWGENIGWIHFKNTTPAYGVVADMPDIDVQGNGVSIANGDITPSSTDDTDFGSVTVGGTPVTHTFTISNIGVADLNLTGTPPVSLTVGTHFNVTAQPTSPVISNTTTTFAVTFDPLTAGSFTDTVYIANNDADENPYTFVISGTGTAVAAEPDIAILSPSGIPVTGHPFGSADVGGPPITVTFTISNSGAGELLLTGAPAATLSDGTNFSIITQPTSSVGSNATSTFVIAFAPTAAGELTDTVTIPNNDPDENPKTLRIRGTGTGTATTYTLTIATAGTGTGVVTPTVGTHSYISGTPVTLAATPHISSTFAGWSGDADCADGAVTMDANKACTATFNVATTLDHFIYLPLVMRTP